MDAGPRSDVVLAMPLPTDASSASRARAAVGRSFAGLPDEVLDDAQLLVSEAVTDAVTTSEPSDGVPLRLTGFLTGTTMRVEVEQERRTAPAPGDRLGSQILDRLASRWGHLDRGSGSTTWFELELADRGR